MDVKISIIMASFNQGHFIECAIESFISQKYTNKELIIVDGGSTDNTLEIINKYRESIAIVISEKDRGMYHARNKGMFLAKGDVIGFLNADDLLAEQALLTVGKLFSHNIKTEMLVGLCQGMNKDGTLMPKTVLGQFTINPRTYFFKMKTIPDQSTFFKRDILASVGLYNCSYRFGADTEIKNRCIKSGINILQVSNILAYWRIYPNTITHKRSLKWPRLIEAIRINRIYAGHYVTYYNVRLLIHYLFLDDIKLIIKFLLQIHKNNGLCQ